ncbi:MAG: hypothetical protein HC826_01915 [Rhodospirillales bacterium]|nr:hypothetical protein [Rhodospirillales bacterium]
MRRLLMLRHPMLRRPRLRRSSSVWLIAFLVLATVILSQTAIGTASAQSSTGSVFSLREIISEIERQLNAVDQTGSVLHIKDASIELSLVETGDKASPSLAVPGADFAVAADEKANRPILKRRIVLELSPASDEPPAAAPIEKTDGTVLSSVLIDMKREVEEALAANHRFDLKKLTADLDFVVRRNKNGSPSLIVFEGGRTIKASDVQGIKIRFATRENNGTRGTE